MSRAAAWSAPAAAVLLATVTQAGTLRVTGAWVANVPGPNTAAYFVLHNDSARPVALIGASSAAATAAEVHGTSRVAGRDQMRPIPRLAIPARDSVVLAPGGTHLMLIGLRAPMSPGRELPITLRFSNGQVLALRARAPWPKD